MKLFRAETLVYVWCLGHIQSRVVYYLMNIRVLPRTIYVARVSVCDAVDVTHAGLYQITEFTFVML